MNSDKKITFVKRIKNHSMPRLTRREVSDGLATAITAFLLGICPLPFSVSPLGIIFFCSASEKALFALAGVLVSAFVSELDTAIYISAVLIALALRIIMRLFIDVPSKTEDAPPLQNFSDVVGGRFFCESLSLRIACAALSVFSLSIYPIVIGGFRYYDLFGAILGVAASVVATPLFGTVFTSGEKADSNRALKKIGKVAIAASLCLTFASFDLKGIEPALAAAFVFVVSLCASEGLLTSLSAAVLCGAVCGAEAIPILIISAFTAYCVLDISVTLAAAVACIAAGICGVAVSGSTFMTDSFLSLLTGCAFYSTAKKLASDFSSNGKGRTAPHTHSFSASEKELLSHTLLKDSVGTFDSLSEVAPSMTCAKELSEYLLKEAETEAEENTELAKSISRRLCELGFGRPETTVTGKRQIKIRICGERLTGSHERLDFIRRRTEQLTSFPLSLPKTDESGKVLLLQRESLISYHHAVATSPKEEVCGDTAEVFFDKRRNMLYALICDGMGSGEDAAEISSKSVNLLKALILGGFPPEKAVKALVSFLRTENAGKENSTTVDLLALDLYDGKARLIKSGSAPSYIIKKGEIIRLSSRTMPMGIFDTADLEKQNLELKSGEIFIMASDGVAESEADGIALLDYLNSHRNLSPEELVSDIMERSRKNEKKDDLSAIAIKIFPGDY